MFLSKLVRMILNQIGWHIFDASMLTIHSETPVLDWNGFWNAEVLQKMEIYCYMLISIYFYLGHTQHVILKKEHWHN